MPIRSASPCSQHVLTFSLTSDTGSFGSLQALPSFLRRFGERTGDGVYVLPTDRKAIMNSVPWIGKILGCIVIEPLIDRFGYRASMIITAGVQIVALIIEMTSKEWIQFTIGRNFAYTAVGLVSFSSDTFSMYKSAAPTDSIPSQPEACTYTE